MTSLHASKVDLSSISSQELWIKSGRLNKINSELFLLKDRKNAGYLLSPTHEEEITALVADSVKSYKELPVRLYQVSRKYRDELRPRHGLLRSREFVMKDLYTFDITKDLALETYHAVRKTYCALFDELKVPYLVADADSGDIGGDLSHEFHFPTCIGEDNIISCTSCEYVANEELAETSVPEIVPADAQQAHTFLMPEQLMTSAPIPSDAFTVWRGVSRDRSTLINVWYAVKPRENLAGSTAYAEINVHAVKALVSDLDSGVENPVAFWGQLSQVPKKEATQIADAEIKIVNIIDLQLPATILDVHKRDGRNLPIRPPHATYKGEACISTITQMSAQLRSLLRIQDGDKCPKCQPGVLKVEKAIELGHTFYLGTRYSEPLNAMVTIPSSQRDRGQTNENPRDITVPMQMGCHGIGVSRMMGAVAETLSDDKGLNWPRAIAPYEVLIVASKSNEHAIARVYNQLATSAIPDKKYEAIVDDRSYSLAWKLNDADLIGYPIVVVIGRAWESKESCEVQCRQLNIRREIPFGMLNDFVGGLLKKL